MRIDDVVGKGKGKKKRSKARQARYLAEELPQEGRSNGGVKKREATTSNEKKGTENQRWKEKEIQQIGSLYLENNDKE